MYTLTRKVTRPNTALEFRNMLHESVSAEVRQHWVTTYKDPGKCLFVNTEMSETGLEMITTMFWDSKDSWNEYQNDPILQTGLFVPIHAYQDENGFTRELVSEEEM
jgi:hypothetical protein